MENYWKKFKEWATKEDFTIKDYSIIFIPLIIGITLAILMIYL